MTQQAISRFPVPDLAALPADLQQLFREVSEKAGFVPNVLWVMARRPEELRAFWAYHEALMRRESGLSKSEREMIVVATSAENKCLYCVVAHGAILRVYEKSTVISEEIGNNSDCKYASYRQEHPLESMKNIIIGIKNTVEPKTILLKSIEVVRNRIIKIKDEILSIIG